MLRASTQNVLDDLARAVDDGINCVKVLCQEAAMLPGGAATEIELARQISAYAKECPGLDQYSIEKFAEALEVGECVALDGWFVGVFLFLHFPC